MDTPDNNADGLSRAIIDPGRYDGHIDAPWEVAGMLKSLMPSGVRVLDVGCGTGSVTLIANAGKNNDVIAVEPDGTRASIARSRGINVHEGYFDNTFTNKAAPFDIVMSSDVLEHMASPSEALRMFKTVLKPNGRILISVPNVAHWSVRANLLFGRFRYEEVGIMDATHLRWFTTQSIIQMVEDAGYKIESISHTAGVTLPVYMRGVLGVIPSQAKNPAIRLATNLVPNLFGVQHVIDAVIA